MKMNKLTCKQCLTNHKSLTREWLCYHCHLAKYKEWPIEFTADYQRGKNK